MWYLAAAVTALVVYLVLQQADDSRNRREGKPPSGAGSRAMLGFLVLVVCLVLFYLGKMAMTSGGKGLLGGASVAEGAAATGAEAWYRSIPEDIRVGFPSF